MNKYQQTVDFIKALYPNQDFIPLHAPVFIGNESRYVNFCITSTFVSSVGEYVDSFQKVLAAYTGSKYAVCVVNGTAALQIGLQLVGVERGDEVITQPLTFIATANAISHTGAKPVFVDVDLDTMGMSPEKLEDWLSNNTKYDPSTNKQINKSTNKPVSAIVPMHTFGFPCRIDEIVEIGNKYNIPVVEDSAESLGSFYKNKHSGTFGKVGIFSFNGNKTVTTGGGGMLVTDDESIAKRALHITTTGKIPHRWEYVHDIVAYNYRLTNLNAALGVAQMEYIDEIIANKRETAKLYSDFFSNQGIKFFTEPMDTISNYWLNTIVLNDFAEREEFLRFTNDNGIMTRPAWRLMNKLEMYKDCQKGNLDNSEWFEERIVNIPSSYRKL